MSDGVFDSGGGPNFPRGPDAPSCGGVSVRRLRQIEALLGVSIEPASGPDRDGAPMDRGRADDKEIERQAIELLRAFNRITDPKARREVLRLVREAAVANRN